MSPIRVPRASLPSEPSPESSPTEEESSEVPLDDGASSAELSLSDALSVSYTHLRAHET